MLQKAARRADALSTVGPFQVFHELANTAFEEAAARGWAPADA